MIGQILPRDEDRAPERMWPLDIALAVLGGLVLYTVASRLRVDDPRPLHNAWTYFVGIPVGIMGLSLLLRNVASRFMQRSMQLGFLASVLVHLLLLIAAFNYVILAPFWPAATSGVQPVRAPIRKTVPDYLFTRSELPQKQPDWSRPIEASTSSRVMPREERKLPTLADVAERLEMPHEQPTAEPVDQPHVTPQRASETALPTPALSASRLSRQDLRRPPQIDQAIDVPELPAAATTAAAAVERSLDSPDRRTASLESAPALDATVPLAADTPATSAITAVPQPRIERRIDSGQPRIGEMAADAERPLRRQRDPRQSPAGAAPTTPALQVARDDPSAAIELSDRPAAIERRQGAEGASLQQSSDAAGAVAATGVLGAFDAPLARVDRASAGVPQIFAGGESVAIEERNGRGRRVRPLPEGSFGVPDLSDIASSQGILSALSASGAQQAAPSDRAAADAARREGNAASGADTAALGAPPPAGQLDLDLPLGPPGLAVDPARRVGLPHLDPAPEVAALDFGRPSDRRAELGGPVPPAGSEVTDVRPFERRTMRTSGGAAPTPAGFVGPQTEEAIERGLAYLAERQNPDGSWSLQGHGEEVVMRSDTAATGLCLLAFQGGGYTHRQHQYAETVARGLEFLIRSQRANGDLYRPEDAASNRNAWLYSHGIAALAMCEAYGMTRDPELRDPAQRSIDFIVETQDPRGGGWRYQPRNGSDTSVTGWMMMALKSGELSGLEVPESTYRGIDHWMDMAQQGAAHPGLYRYNPEAPNTPAQAHGRQVTPPMTAVGLLTRLYSGWKRDNPNMQQGAAYLGDYLPQIGTRRDPQRDTYYWYYATQVMFHMGGSHWDEWNGKLNPLLVSSQLRSGPDAGSWDPQRPIPDRWAAHAGRLYVTTMNLLSLEVYYRHLPIYGDTAK